MRRAPPPIHDAAAGRLTGLPEGSRQLFALRLDRWWDDLHGGLAAVYDDREIEPLEHRLVVAAADAFGARDGDLARLDLVRSLEPGWLQSPAMVGYAAYADRFAGDLAGVASRIGYLRELGITYLHLMPLLQTRAGDGDGGYAVADYRQVQPHLGTMDDLRSLGDGLRANGISLCLDLVLNHVAREHPWAAAARAGDEKYRRYFHIFATRAEPDAYERSLPEVFPDFAPGNFTWDDDLDGWVWTTFNAFQWDVNWANPDVFAEYAEIILFLANVGVEVLRLDAIAFLWKRLGTDCQNQPEVHALTRALRALARIACPAVAFKAEAIVAPAQLAQYLGLGRYWGKLSDLAYHNSLMVQIWSMLATRDVRLAVRALTNLPPIPPATAWITYVRGHDDIGWAIDDGDAAAEGLSGPAHRAFLSDYYAGIYPGSGARGLVFQRNEVTGDRRISGTTASLAGLDAAAPGEETDLAVARILLAYAIAFGWGGVPVIWSGDELGLTDDPAWAQVVGHGADNRWAHRPALPWERIGDRRDPATVAGRVWAGLVRLAGVRAGLAQLDASFPAEILPPADPGVLAVLRRHPLGPMVGLYNVTDSWRPWLGDRLDDHGLATGRDAISGHAIEIAGDGQVWLAPYTPLWMI